MVSRKAVRKNRLGKGSIPEKGDKTVMKTPKGKVVNKMKGKRYVDSSIIYNKELKFS